MTDTDFLKVIDDQINQLFSALIFSNNLMKHDIQDNFELNYINLINAYLNESNEQKPINPHHYLQWIDNQLSRALIEIRSHEESCNIGLEVIGCFYSVTKELGKMLHGSEIQYKVGMENIRYIFSCIKKDILS